MSLRFDQDIFNFLNGFECESCGEWLEDKYLASTSEDGESHCCTRCFAEGNCLHEGEEGFITEDYIDDEG